MTTHKRKGESTVQALILAGGSGTRFWPMSRGRRPKQFLSLDGDRSMLQATVDRLAPAVSSDRIWISTTETLAADVRKQLPDVPESNILIEPVGRDTAPAIGWAVQAMTMAIGERSDETSSDGLNDAVVVLPADHRIAEPEPFREVLLQAAGVVDRDDRVIALGVTPRWPETGYGYLELGDDLPGADALRQVVRFTEKPQAEDAQRFVDSGRYLWNAGIFVFRGSTLLSLLAEHHPELAAGLDQIASDPSRLDELYPHLPRVSIDFGLMEKLDSIATLPLDCGWNDLGSWEALAQVLAADESGNRARGDVLTVDSSDNLLFADEGTIAVVGVDNLVVVRTGDSVLVMPRERSQDVRKVVDRLKADGRSDRL